MSFQKLEDLIKSNDSDLFEEYSITFEFSDVLREYDEHGELEFLNGEIKKGYFKGVSQEITMSWSYDLSKNNINDIVSCVKKIEAIKNGEKNLTLKGNELPDHPDDEDCDLDWFETSADEFYIGKDKVDPKLWYSEDIFDSGRWSGDFSTQDYDYDDNMILATSDNTSSVDWYLE